MKNVTIVMSGGWPHKAFLDKMEAIKWAREHQDELDMEGHSIATISVELVE